MAKVTVDIPQSAIDEKTKKALDAANRKIVNLEGKILQLQMQISSNEEIVRQSKDLLDHVKSTYSLYTYEEAEKNFSGYY